MRNNQIEIKTWIYCSNIIFKKCKSGLSSYYFSLKGLLNNTPFKKEDGDKFLEEFLSIIKLLIIQIWNK